MLDKLNYNLQFFGEEDDANNLDDNNNSSDDNTGSDGAINEQVQALAEIISDKDKELKELTKQVEELKKANAKMVVQMSTGSKDSAKTFDENLLDLVGYKPRKE